MSARRIIFAVGDPPATLVLGHIPVGHVFLLADGTCCYRVHRGYVDLSKNEAILAPTGEPLKCQGEIVQDCGPLRVFVE